jgi:Fe-S cluster assembly protein SufD
VATQARTPDGVTAEWVDRTIPGGHALTPFDRISALAWAGSTGVVVTVAREATPADAVIRRRVAGRRGVPATWCDVGALAEATVVLDQAGTATRRGQRRGARAATALD